MRPFSGGVRRLPGFAIGALGHGKDWERSLPG
jgi:hypothetical protein